MRASMIFLSTIMFLHQLPPGSLGIQWLALSRLSSIASVNSMSICEKMKGSLIRKQIKFCKKNPNFMDSVRLGAARAVDECQHQFQSRRWNCSTLESRVERRLSIFRHKLSPSGNSLNLSMNSFPLDLRGGGSGSHHHLRSKRQGRRLLMKENNRTNGSVPLGVESILHSRETSLEEEEEDNEEPPEYIHQKSSSNILRGEDKNRGKKLKMSAEDLGGIDLSDLENLLSKARNRAKGFSGGGVSNGGAQRRHGGNGKNKGKKQGGGGALGPYPIVSPGTREMAFVHAISSAGVAHALTRACSSGDLENCGCDRSLRGMSPRGFQWSGCSDNVDFGITFSRTFVDARDRRKSRKKPTRAQPLMNLHNNEAGRKLLERNMKIECKCHGVSGSCELKTCWRSIASFRIIGEILKEKFDNAHEVTQKKRRGRRMLLPRYHKFKPHTDTDLVYLKVSPDYCDFDVQKGSLGTRGRECNPDSESAQGCNFMCCNRGFETRLEKRVERCKCKFHWCCYVECEECYREVKVSTCN